MSRARTQSDLVAGLTVAALLVPQAMAYALLAGLPPEVGLYAATVPLLAYAALGTSPQLAVGPVAIVSLITATTLATVADEFSDEWVAAAALLAVLVGLVHLLLSLVRLGSLVRLLPHAVLVGFTAAAAVTIALSQARHLLGVELAKRDHLHETVVSIFAALGDAHPTTVLLGGGALVTIVALKRRAPRTPIALVVVATSLLAVELFDLETRGVATVGAIPDALPTITVPTFSGSLVAELLPAAIVITLVGFMESIAVAKVYARKHDTTLDPNRELLALGAANIASGMVGGYPVTGGFSRTAVNNDAGARTRLASVITAFVVVASIAFLTPILDSLPRVTLGVIIVAAVIGLIDVAEMRRVATTSRRDLLTLGVAFAATLVLGIELGLAIAVVVSIALQLGARLGGASATASAVDATHAIATDRVTVDTSLEMTVHSEH